MSQYLLYGGFKCLNQNEVDKFDVNTIECKSIKQVALTDELLKNYMNYILVIH